MKPSINLQPLKLALLVLAFGLTQVTGWASSGSEHGEIEAASLLTGGGSDIKMYPNPTKGNFHIEFSEIVEGGIDLYIMNAAGRIVQQEYLEEQNRFNINVSNLPPGIYFCQFTRGDVAVTKRLVIN